MNVGNFSVGPTHTKWIDRYGDAIQVEYNGGEFTLRVVQSSGHNSEDVVITPNVLRVLASLLELEAEENDG